MASKSLSGAVANFFLKLLLAPIIIAFFAIILPILNGDNEKYSKELSEYEKTFNYDLERVIDSTKLFYIPSNAKSSIDHESSQIKIVIQQEELNPHLKRKLIILNKSEFGQYLNLNLDINKLFNQNYIAKSYSELNTIVVINYHEIELEKYYMNGSSGIQHYIIIDFVDYASHKIILSKSLIGGMPPSKRRSGGSADGSLVSSEEIVTMIEEEFAKSP